jgi:hypothetical protein
MQYREMGRSRLEVAKGLATQIVEKLPAGSRAAVLDLQSATRTTSLRSPSTDALEEIRAIAPSASAESAGSMLRAAEGLLAQATEERREIYLFTDMTANAWRGLAQEALAQYDHVPVYVIDVGISENQNVALDLPKLSSRFVSRNAPVTIATTVTAGQRQAGRTVVLEIGGALRQRRPVELKSPGEAAVVPFEETFSEAGLVQGNVSLLEGDPLAADNVRYFTLQVGQPPRVAVIRGDNFVGAADDDAYLVATALAPTGLAARGRAAVAPTALPASALSPQQLKNFEAVFLADAVGISDEGWAALERFVADGGGLVVLAGRAVAEELKGGKSSYQGSAAARLLPARFGPVRESQSGSRFAVPTYDVAALADFDHGHNGDLAQPIIYRWFELQPAAGSRTILTVADKSPALVGTSYKGGGVYLLATAPQKEWSNLGGQAEFVILLHSLLDSLRGQSGEGRGYLVGGPPVTFTFPRSLAGQVATLAGPGLGSPVPSPINPTTATATFGPLAQPGNYQIRVGDTAGAPRFGFSLNIDPAESRLAKRPPDSVGKIFAPGMFHVTQSLEGLRYAETLVRRGRERTASLVPFLMAILVLELLLANRFYRRKA